MDIGELILTDFLPDSSARGAVITGNRAEAERALKYLAVRLSESESYVPIYLDLQSNRGESIWDMIVRDSTDGSGGSLVALRAMLDAPGGDSLQYVFLIGSVHSGVFDRRTAWFKEIDDLSKCRKARVICSMTGYELPPALSGFSKYEIVEENSKFFCSSENVQHAFYQELVSRYGYTKESIAERLMENDRALYDQIGIENEGFSETWSSYLSCYPETFQYMINMQGEIVGNWSVLAPNPNQIERISRGEFCESAFQPEETEFLLFPGRYKGLYILNFSLNEGFQSARNYSALWDSFLAQMLNWAEAGIYFEQLYVNVFRPDHKALFRRLGFQHLRAHHVNGDVYSFPLLSDDTAAEKFIGEGSIGEKLREAYERGMTTREWINHYERVEAGHAAEERGVEEGPQRKDQFVWKEQTGSAPAPVETEDRSAVENHPKEKKKRKKVSLWLITVVVLLLTLIAVALGRGSIAPSDPLPTVSADGSSEGSPVPVTTALPVTSEESTSAPEKAPSEDDLLEIGTTIIYPQPESYLSDYETKYIKSSKGYGGVYLYCGPQRTESYRRGGIDEKTEVSVIARENSCSCIIFLLPSGRSKAGWVASEYLVDTY